MYERLRNLTLLILKVPPEPHAPTGDPASLRVFNAGRNYFRLRLFRWGIAQSVALAGFIFWTALLLEVEEKAVPQKAGRESQVANTNLVYGPSVTLKKSRKNLPKQIGERVGRATIEVEKGPKKRSRVHPWEGFKQLFDALALLLPSGAFVLIWAVKILSFIVYAAQIPLTYAILRLDYEMRWYMVTDRSLRLRSGVWRLSEATMSFANVQQVLVSQGPLQRLLGLADVKVKSAGGGSGGHNQHEGHDMHTGLFHSVTNAEEIRDLIIDRLRRFREAGLGDLEDKAPEERLSVANNSGSLGALAAARDMLAEARALGVLVRSRWS